MIGGSERPALPTASGAVDLTSSPGRGAGGSAEGRVRADPVGRSGGRSDGSGSVGASRAMARALASVVVLLSLLVGVPALLLAVASALPIDVSALSPAGLLRPGDGSLVLLVVLAIAWVAWAVMLVSVAVEAWAAIRRVPSPRLVGLAGPQHVAAGLVAAVVVGLGAVGSTTPSEPSPTPLGLAASVSLLSSTAPALEVVQREVAPRDRSVMSPTREERSGPGAVTVTTVRHDTLWQIAADTLGSGERFVEIVALNEGVLQSDGRALRADGRLYPGWSLRLPADANVPPVDPPVHRVESGDTLWGIAQEALGDPTRYPEVFALNEGEPQKDGRALTDPDLIVPGWRLELPSDAPVRDGEVAAAPELDRAVSSPQSARPRQVPAPSADASLPPLDRTRQTPSGGGSEANQRVVTPGPTEGTPARGSESPWPHPRPSKAPIPATSPTAGASESSSATAAESSAPSDPAGRSEPPIDRAAVLPDSALEVPVGGVLGVVLLAGFAGELARRRRVFQRYRHPGERLVAPTADGRALEDLTRAAAGDTSFELLDRALGQLWENCRATGATAPAVRVVRIGARSLTIELTEACLPAVPPFRPVSERSWQLDPMLLDAGDAPHGGLPGLVTVGMHEDQTILVNLPELGTMRVSGEVNAVPGVVRAFASELLLGPGAHGASCTLCLTDARLSGAVLAASEAGDIGVEPDPARVAVALTRVMACTEHASWDDDPVELVLSDQPLPVVVRGRRRAGLITTDPAAPADVELVLSADGSADLLPDGIRVVPQSLAAGASAELLGLLRATEVPDDPEPDVDKQDRVARDLGVQPVSDPCGSAADRFATGRADTNPVPSGAGRPTSTAPGQLMRVVTVPEARPASRSKLVVPAPAAPVAAPASGSGRQELTAESAGVDIPEILLLGEVRVQHAHGRAESTRIGRLAETAAFVLLNPDSRPSALQTALWPGRRSNPATCRQMISRTRTWLGRGDDGLPFLMQLADNGGRLRLRPEVGSDWDRFQRLAAAGLADPEDTDSLTAALRLVRGRPFGPVTARELPWADLVVNDMICLITDVAYELALRHEAAGQWAAARDAVLRGLRTESESGVLTEILARLGRRA